MTDGGPAFPLGDIFASDGSGYREGSSGMSLRDYFAGQVIAGFAANPGLVARVATPSEAASKAFEIADRMLAARAVPTPALTKGEG